MEKLYTNEEYAALARQASETGETLYKVQGMVDYTVEVYEYEKKTIQVPIYNEQGEIIGYEDKEVDDLTKPIMIEVIDPETGETILVHKHHTETRQKYAETLDIKPAGYYICSESNITDGTLNPDFDAQQEQKRREAFNKAFFATSLGYVRRSVTMADGTHKDFLSDLLPVITMGMQSGQIVNILAYDEPDFTQDITDWEEYQKQVAVTPQFIQECFLQLSNDFKPINEE